MFNKDTYRERRDKLKKIVGKGLILLFGNDESPMNYTDNTYHFRQDSTFLYYFGIQQPGLAAVIDIDRDLEVVFGDEYTVEDYVWRGPQPTIASLAEKCGVESVQPAENLAAVLGTAQQKKQTIHFLPLYRHENKIRLYELLGVTPGEIAGSYSVALVKAVVSQREIKTGEGIVNFK